jgi:metallo-beta-lactamase class B
MLIQKRFFLFILALLGFLGCSPKLSVATYSSPTLQVEQLTENTFIHTSYLQAMGFGKVVCNGLVVKSGSEAIIIDTPVNDSVSAELIYWVENTLRCKIKAVIVTHFHVDCLGGLEAFHKRNIPSYANQKTIALAEQDSATIPQKGFTSKLELSLGTQKVIGHFLGEGHTIDNIIVYYPSEKVLFGGCLVKTNGSGKGNLTDANIKKWSNTVEKVKATYPQAKRIIPGHGPHGDQELLDYTINLFKN